MITDADKLWLSGYLDGRASMTVQRGVYKTSMAMPEYQSASQRILRLIPRVSVHNEQAIATFDARVCSEHCPEPHEHVKFHYSLMRGQVFIPQGKTLILCDNLAGMSAYADFNLPILLRHKETSRNAVVRGWDEMESVGWTVRPEWRVHSRLHGMRNK